MGEFFLQHTMHETRATKYEQLGCEESVGFTGGYFTALVSTGVAQGKDVVIGGADISRFDKFDAAVAEEDVLAATFMIDTV